MVLTEVAAGGRTVSFSDPHGLVLDPKLLSPL
jgi:hypothetical protein